MWGRLVFLVFSPPAPTSLHHDGAEGTEPWQGMREQAILSRPLGQPDRNWMTENSPQTNYRLRQLISDLENENRFLKNILQSHGIDYEYE